jgi:hypothetical protein
MPSLCSHGTEIHVTRSAGARSRILMATDPVADYPKLLDVLKRELLEKRDFTIVIKSSDAEKVLDRIPVHHGLLALRVP